MTSKILFLGYLSCLLQCGAAHGPHATQDPALQDHQDEPALNDEALLDDEVALLQQYVATIVEQKHTAKSRKVPDFESVVNPRRSGAWILRELKDAKDKRERLDTRIKALENLLTKKQVETEEEKEHRWALVIPALIFLLVFCYMVWKVVQYKRAAGKFGPPWYHDSTLMSRVLACGVVCWLNTGIFAFTGFMFFNEEGRHLTPIESVYVSVQVLSTVGYGDFTPATPQGKMFMMVYVLVGVSLVANLVFETVSVYLASAEKEIGRYGVVKKSKFWKQHRSVVIIILFVIFSTVFWGLLPGQEKTWLECLYMTIITLTTVGFGYYTPLTQIGYLIGALWMLVGTVLMAQALTDISNMVAEHRQGLNSKSSAMRFFERITQEHYQTNQGRLDRADFLAFEMIRSGQEEDTITRAMKVFKDIDTNQSDYLNVDEFRAYVKLIYGDEASK